MAESVTKPDHVSHEVGDYFTWALVVALGMLGPLLAHGARDDEMFLFGMSLFAFSAIFLFAEIKRHYDAADRAHAVILVETAP